MNLDRINVNVVHLVKSAYKKHFVLFLKSLNNVSHYVKQTVVNVYVGHLKLNVVHFKNALMQMAMENVLSVLKRMIAI